MNITQFYTRKAIGFVVIIVLVGVVSWLIKSEPVVSPDDGWKTTTTSQGVTFRYPDKIPTTYISAVEWPPQVTQINGNFACAESGSEVTQAGRTEKLKIDGREYCLTKVSESAAGSTYTQYLYTTATPNKKLINITFSLRFVQCVNYDDPKKTECLNERSIFNIDSLIDKIVRSI